MPADGGGFADWIGRSITADDIAAEGPLRRLAATLDHDGGHWPTGALPPLAHWLYHLPDAKQSALGRDGHPTRGEFLPPIAQPRRMWAGGRLTFLAPIAIGASLRRTTTILRIEDKGAMTFVTLRHAIDADGVRAATEEQDIVYLPIAPPAPPKPVDLPDAESARRHRADEALLFRFSALTFNAHRIHYDRAYARDVELYPGPVVHGPLQAMLLIDHALRDGVLPGRFAFRARAPLYTGQEFVTARAGGRLWVREAGGTVTMTAEL